MKKVLIDSSVWVSYFRRDTNFAAAKSVLQDIINEKMIIILPTIVFVEVINTLCRFNDHSKEVELALKFNAELVSFEKKMVIAYKQIRKY